MRGVGSEQCSVCGFEHQAHAGGDGGEASDPFGREQAGVGVGQQPGLAQNQFAHGFEIVQRGFVAEVMQGFAHFGKEQFGFVAQAEKGFGASQLFPGVGHGEDFIRRHCMGAGLAGIAAEGAVSAIVTAKIGQGQEDLARVSDHAGLEALFGCAGGGEEFGEVVVMAAD